MGTTDPVLHRAIAAARDAAAQAPLLDEILAESRRSADSTQTLVDLAAATEPSTS